MKKVFRAKHLLTCNETRDLIEDAFLAIENDKIVDLGPWKKRPRVSSFKIEELGPKLVMPGLFNLHTHLPMNLFRGMAEDVDLHTWLQKFIFPAEKRFVKPSFVRLGAQLAVCELIRAGITYVGDMYFYSSEIADVLDEFGLRGLLAQSYFDRGGFDAKSLDESYSHCRKLAKKLKNHPRIQAGLGPHAPYTCSLETLKSSAELAKELELPVLIHISETKKELSDIKRQTGFSPVRMVKESGLFEAPRLLSAHSIWLEDYDFSIMRNEKVTAVLNPNSNAKLGAGVAPVRKLMTNKVRIALGTDSAASNNRLDMFSEMNMLAKLYHLNDSDMTSLTTKHLVDMVTRNAAEAVGLSSRLGSLEPGKDADFICLDLDRAHLTPMTDPYNHLIYSAQSGDVESVYVAGRCLMKNWKLRGIPEATIKRDANLQWKKIKSFLLQQ